MPILDDNERATLAAFLTANPGRSDAEIFELMYAPTPVPNPAPQTQIPRPFAATTLTLAVDPARRAGLLPFLGDIAHLIPAQDRAGIGQWGAELLLLGLIQQADVDAIKAVLTAADPDPSWAATVTAGPSWAATNLGCFGEKVWVNPDTGSSHDFVPIEAIAEARS